MNATWNLYCSCGSSWEMRDNTGWDAKAAVAMLKQWSRDHKGNAHVLVDAETAAHARRKALEEAAG